MVGQSLSLNHNCAGQHSFGYWSSVNFTKHCNTKNKINKAMTATIFKNHLFVLLATALVAGSFIVSENLAGIINPFSLTLLRFAGAALILSPLIIYKKEWRVKVWPTLPRGMVIGFFFAAFFIGLFEALNTTTALNTGTLYTLVPMGTALLSAFFLKDRINRKILLVYLFGAIGTTWVVFQGDIDALLSFSLNEGDFIFLLASLSMCCYSVLMKFLYRNDDMVVLVFCTLLGGSFWLVLALVFLNQPLEWHLITTKEMANIAYLILASTLLTMYLYQRTTVFLGPSSVNTYIFLNPALVAVLLFFVHGTVPKIAIIPGVFVSVLATVFLQMIGSKQREESSTS